MQVRTGTVTVTSGSATVTGTDTTWRTGVLPGAMFLVRGDATPYYVATVVSDTQITLSAPYQGTTRGDQFYWITTSFTPNRSYPIPENGDVDPALILSRAISEIDADIGSGGGGGGVTRLGQLADVSETGVTTGDVLTRLASGTYGFAPAGTALIDGSNLGTGAGLFAGKSGNSLTFKGLKVSGVGASLVSTTTDVTLTLPAPGEINTASSIGSLSSSPVFKQKTGVNLEFFGLRAGSNITLTPDGSDIVIASTATGGTGGEANTASNVGTGTVSLFKSKIGVNLGFRTLQFDGARFGTTLSQDGNTYTITATPLAFSGLTGVNLTGASNGQYLRYDSADSTWKPAAIAATGIASVSADPAPALGGNLTLGGNRILGQPGSYSGHIEKPKVKTYTIEVSCPTPRTLASVTAVCATGNVNFTVTTGDVFVENPEGGTSISGLSGQTGTGGIILTPTAEFTIPQGSALYLKITSVDNLVADFTFTISYQSA